MWKDFEGQWGDFGINIGPIGVGVMGPYKVVRYTHSEDSEVIRLDLNPGVKKEQIKVRLIEPGILEIERPRIKGEGAGYPSAVAN